MLSQVYGPSSEKADKRQQRKAARQQYKKNNNLSTKAYRSQKKQQKAFGNNSQPRLDAAALNNQMMISQFQSQNLDPYQNTFFGNSGSMPNTMIAPPMQAPGTPFNTMGSVLASMGRFF